MPNNTSQFSSFIFIILINLIVANGTVFYLLPDLNRYDFIIISVLIILIYAIYFIANHHKRKDESKIIAQTITLTVLCVIAASSVIAIDYRFFNNSVDTDQISEIFPISTKALIFTFPVWLFLGLVNFFFINRLTK